MPTSVPVPAAEMTQPPHPQPGEPHAATPEPPPVTADDPHTAPAAATTLGADPPAAGAGRLWVATALIAALTAVVTVVGGVLGTLLVREFNSIDAQFAKIDDKFAAQDANIDARFAKLETELDAQFAAQDANIDARFAKLETELDDEFAEVDERFDALEAGQQEIALTLAALVAYLRADEGVDAALPGRLLDPAADPAEARSAQPQADALAAAEADGGIGSDFAPASAD